MSKLRVESLEKYYDNKPVLKDITFTVAEGEVLTLLGPSGCGKSTTLKIIAGLINEFEGEIFLQEESIKYKPMEKRGAVIVFQNHLLFPHLTVEDNIGFGLKMAGIKKSDRQKKVSELLELVQLTGYNKKSPSELSGGQQQRVALARALAVEPKVLLLDEPFSNLDSKLREEMRDLSLRIQKEKKITMILVTHDKEEAMICSDRIAIMLEGEIKQIGTPSEIYYRPTSKLVADFMGEKNYMEGKIINGRFISSILEIDSTFEEEKQVLLMIKPEDILLSSERKNINGKIMSVQFAGERTFYILDIKGILFKTIQSSHTVFKVGEEVGIDFRYDLPIIFEKQVQKID